MSVWRRRFEPARGGADQPASVLYDVNASTYRLFESGALCELYELRARYAQCTGAKERANCSC